MKKFIMLLASLAMGGSILLGILNKSHLEEVVADLDSTNGEVSQVTQALGEEEDKRDAAVERETQAKDERNRVSAEVEGVKQQMKVVDRSIEEVEGDLKRIEIEQKEIDLAIERIFPDGDIKSADDLRMRLTMAKEMLMDKQNEKTELESRLVAADSEKKAVVAKVQEEENFQRSRAQKLALNGLVATVIAVNNDWGFVIVNAGRAHGVSADSSLLVKRGNSRIARLRITSLQDMITVTDVVDESLSSGISVQPGDKVIFESIR